MEESLISNLIPGLPDEVAMLCFARLPFGLYPLLSCVCSSWRRALQLPLLFSIRAQLGLQQPFVFVVVDVRRSMEPAPSRIAPLCYLMDSRLAKCYPLALPPCWWDSPHSDKFHSHFFSDVVIALGPQVFILPKRKDSPGSWGVESLCFDMMSRLWCGAHFPPMLESRPVFASATVDGYVYAAGSYGFHLPNLKSAERFNLASKKWERIPDMTERRSGASGVAWKGSFCVHGGLSDPGLLTRSTSAEVWDALKEEWQLITGFCPDDIRSVVSVKGKLYALKYEHEEYVIMWLDEKAKHWIPLDSLKGALQGHLPKETLGVGDELWMLAFNRNWESTFWATDPESLPLCWRSLPFPVNTLATKVCVVTL